MIQAMRYAGSYYQGRNALEHFSEYAQGYGEKLCFIGSKSALKATQKIIEESFRGKRAELSFLLTSGIPWAGEVERLLKQSRKEEPEVICGIGGGAVMDLARAVGNKLGVPIIMIPTVCSSDAPCTNVSVIYDEIKLYFLIISLKVLICRYSLYLQAFRHFSYRKMFLNILISPHVSAFKGSRKSSKTSIYYYAISRSISANALSEVA